MGFRASAPGKLVVLGEYAVLTGAEALVMAVNRRCQVEIRSVGAAQSRLLTRTPDAQEYTFAPAEPSGLALVDTVRFGLAGQPLSRPFDAVLDSSAFFAQSGPKLGLGSSAAVLTAWAGALQAYENKDVSALTLMQLVTLHRRLQGGRGSGIDVAAALHGGLLSFRLESGDPVQAGSVRLPNSVGFAGIFAGKSATTSDFVGRFGDWRRAQPQAAEQLLGQLADVSAGGCDAVRAADADAFLAAVAEYGVLLDALGKALRCDVLTPEHRRIAALAERFAVTYKTSGAGGGDLGIAFSRDAEALRQLQIAVAAEGFLWVDLEVDPQGLKVEELTE